MNYPVPTSPRHDSPAQATARPDSQRGFALVIALSLMAFVLVLLLTLTSLVRVETSSAQNQLAQLEARQNARLGAMIALGELQKSMGPDTRVSAPTLDATAPENIKWITSAVDSSAYVYDASNNLVFNTNFARPVRYLMSAPDPNDFDPTNSDPAVTFFYDPFDASSRVNQGYALLVGAGALGATDANGDGIPDTLMDDDGDGIDDRVVAAPLVSFGDNNEASFAWWVADEGQKAQVNVTDPFLNSISPNAARAQATTAQRVGTEAIFSSFDPTSDTQANLLEKATSPQQLSLTGISSVAETRSQFHHITTNSSSLLTNTRRGGLMRDLTAVMEEAANNGGNVDTSGVQWLKLLDYQDDRIQRWREETVALESYVGKPHHEFEPTDQTADPVLAELPVRHWNALQAMTLRNDQAAGATYGGERLGENIFPPMSDMATYWDQGGAKWEQLITWPTFKQRRGTTNVAPARRYLDTMELTPVIAKSSIVATLRISYPEISLHFIPSVVLWNPYDVPIQLPANLRFIQRYDDNSDRMILRSRLHVSHPNWRLQDVTMDETATVRGRPPFGSNRSAYEHIAVKGDSPTTGGSRLWTPNFIFRWSSTGGSNERFVFTFADADGNPSPIIPPGEARIFTMHEHLDVTPSTPGDPIDPTAVLREGLPEDPGQFSVYIRENIEDQMDAHPLAPPYPLSVNDQGGGFHREAVGGYNVWHATGAGGGNFRSRPMMLPYPFPLDPTRLNGDTDRLIYDPAGDLSAFSSAFINNGNYLRNWHIEGIGFEIGRNNNQGNYGYFGQTLALDTGPGTDVLVEIAALQGSMPEILGDARLCDPDNLFPGFATITEELEPEPIPSSASRGLEDVTPVWGFSWGLRLPENTYAFDTGQGEVEGATSDSTIAPIRWLVDSNPVSPFPMRDPSSRAVTDKRVGQGLAASGKVGFDSPPQYIGGFFMFSDRIGDMESSTPDDLSQFIGATDYANPAWTGGAPKAVVYEIPDSFEDITSIGSLMHAPLSVTSTALMPNPNAIIDGNQTAAPTADRDQLPFGMMRSSVNYDSLKPTYMIGNSRAPLWVKRDSAVQTFYPTLTSQDPADNNEAVPFGQTRNPATIRENYSDRDLTNGKNKITSYPASYFPGYDSSWIYNEALWDDFFFSSVNNTRLTWASGRSTADRDLVESGEYLQINGAFNINSVSIPAWAAMLSSMLNVDVLGPGGTPQDTAAFNRFVEPLETFFDDTIDDYYSASAYAGYRRVSADQIWDNGGTPNDYSDDEGLAPEIVRQVRERGPFLSLSDFVNRGLIPAASDSEGHGLAGAIQTAIDRTDLNNAMGNPNDLTSWIDPVPLNDIEIIGASSVSYGPAFQELAMDNLSRWVSDGSSASIELGIDRNAGAPGELTQGDILARIGGVLRPRSDSFTIRAKGVTGNLNAPEAQAWCEVTVQRRPDYVDASGNSSGEIYSDLTPANQFFGRRFEIISFRWLSEEEI